MNLKPLSTEQRKLVEANAHRADWTVTRWMRTHTNGKWSYDDLLSFAHEGLMYAAQTWDPAKGGWGEHSTACMVYGIQNGIRPSRTKVELVEYDPQRDDRATAFEEPLCLLLSGFTGMQREMAERIVEGVTPSEAGAALGLTRHATRREVAAMREALAA